MELLYGRLISENSGHIPTKSVNANFKRQYHKIASKLLQVTFRET